MKLLMFSASLRKASCNKQLIQLVAKIAKDNEVEVDLANFADFTGTLYDADIQTQGFPDEIQHFLQRLSAANGLVISSPEYNFSTPGVLKNLIDWVSRVNPMPWRNYPILLMSASPSLVGGNRGLWSTRVPLEACGAHVFPNMFSLANAYNTFDEHGELKDKDLHQRLTQNIQDFIQFTFTINHLK